MKAVREKEPVSYKATLVRLSAEFSEILQARREMREMVMKEKTYN